MSLEYLKSVAITMWIILAIILAFVFTMAWSMAYGQYATTELEKEVTFPVREEEMVYCFAKADPNPRKNITELDVICNMVTLPEDKQDDMDVYLDNWNRQYIEIEGQTQEEIIGPPINNAQANAEEKEVHDEEELEEVEHVEFDSDHDQRTWGEVLDGGVGGFIDFLKENNDGK